MEMQLEEEYEETQKVLREKRELESKLLTAHEKVRCPDMFVSTVHVGMN